MKVLPEIALNSVLIEGIVVNLEEGIFLLRYDRRKRPDEKSKPLPFDITVRQNPKYTSESWKSLQEGQHVRVVASIVFNDDLGTILQADHIEIKIQSPLEVD